MVIALLFLNSAKIIYIIGMNAKNTSEKIVSFNFSACSQLKRIPLTNSRIDNAPSICLYCADQKYKNTISVRRYLQVTVL